MTAAFQHPRIRSVADIAAIERVPLDQRLTSRTTYDAIVAGAAAAPDSDALIFLARAEPACEPIRFSFRELLGKINQTANLLRDLGVGREDVVSFLLPSLPETQFLLWGGEAAGIVNPLNPFLEPEQIVGLLNTARTKVLVVPGDRLDPDTWRKIDQIRGSVPGLSTILQVGARDCELDGIQSFEALIDRYPADRLTFEPCVDPNSIASYFHTGGTSGTPKLAKHTHRGEVYQAWAQTLHCDIRPGDKVLVGLPLFHVSGAINLGLAPFSIGASVVLLGTHGFRQPDIMRNFWHLVARFQGTFFMGVPTIFASLLAMPLDGADTRSLRYATCGAAPIPEPVLTEMERQTGVKILGAYGLTEATCGGAFNPKDGENRRGSIGFRLAYEQMKVTRLDAEGQLAGDCAVDEIGHLVIKGPHVFPGYVKESQNLGTLLPDGWLKTGDLARQDGDGYFWVTGRAKDVIIRGGHNIDPASIEEVLCRHPAVGIAAAIGRPDLRAGELPVAYVVLRNNQTVTPLELKDFAKANIAERAAAPVEVIILDQMPQTAVGKISKAILRTRAATEVFTAILDGIHGVSGIAVVEDTRHGIAVRITVSGVDEGDRDATRDAVRERMSGFAFHNDILFI